jgi:hypothetical protein
MDIMMEIWYVYNGYPTIDGSNEGTFDLTNSDAFITRISFGNLAKVIQWLHEMNLICVSLL